MIAQGVIPRGWWLPLILGSAALFYAGNVFYVWANNKIRSLTQGGS